MNIAARNLLCAFLFAYAGVPGLQAADNTTDTAPAIAPQPLIGALNEFVARTGMQVVYRSELAAGKKSRGAEGGLPPQQMLEQLLRDTGLLFEFVNPHTVTIRAGKAAPVQAASARAAADDAGLHLVRADNAQSSAAAPLQKATDEREQNASGPQSEGGKGTPEILVKGKRTLNTDMERTEDEPQPYVVFSGEEIRRSQPINLEDFLKTRLPMNASSGTSSQVTSSAVTSSSINLRGLGANQTLILVDGRRLPGRAEIGNPYQPDINGIPIAAVERIEVLPSTAGGIYGGSATGGVINIIMRRDYQGVEAQATYLNTFDTDAASKRLDISTGFTLEGGRTQVMLTATHMESNRMVSGDRDFAQRAFALQLENNPAAVIGTATPPIGRTVNILSNTRNSLGVRQPLVLDQRYGGAPLGQTTTHVPLGYAGPGSDNGAGLVRNAGRYNVELPDDLNGNQRGLFATPAMESVSLNLRREFGARLEGFVDLSRLINKGGSFFSSVPTLINLPGGAPTNPFVQDIVVRFPTPGLSFETQSRSELLRGTAGLIARLPGDWTGELDYGWSRSRYTISSTFNAIDTAGQTSLRTGLPAPNGRPALDVLQEGNTFPIDFTPYLLPSPNRFTGPDDTILQDGTLRLSGPVMELPGGRLNLSASISRREETLEDSVPQSINATTLQRTYALFPGSSQDANSFYLEARAPLLAAMPLVRELELQASVRHDEYTTRSFPESNIPLPSPDAPFPPQELAVSRLKSTDYTIGLRYMPVQDLTLRASFGTGFLPPSVIQIAPNGVVATYNSSIELFDPARNSDVYAGQEYTIAQGGTPDLQPEQSESWSAGMIVTPRFVSGLRLSIDYTRIEKVSEIQFPDFQFLLDNEDIFSDRITRGDALPGEPAGTPGRITDIDARLINIAQTSMEAYDVQVDYLLRTQRHGEFNWYALATRQTHLENQTLPTSPVVDSVGFTGGPLQWRGNLGLNWYRGPVTVGWNAQYYDSYFVYGAADSSAAADLATLNQDSATIPRQIYHDLNFAYRFDRTSSWLGGLLADSDISLGIQNVFDRSPPILAASRAAVAGYSTYGDPRLQRYSLSIRRNFGN